MKKRNRRRSTTRSHRARRTRLFEALEQRCVLSATPTLAPIADITLYEGAPINLPLDAVYDLDGPLTYTVECSDPNLTVYVPEGNRSMKISVSAENGTITGDMIFELFEQRAPRVTNQIISLVEDGFYDGVTFHRIIDEFMIQGGDPTGTGSGGSYYGDFDDQFNTELMHTTSGVLSMAKSTDDTNDSQFFITEVPTRYLDFQHSVFGQLVEGEDIREALSNVATDSNDAPLNAVTMESVTIFEDTENAILVINAPDDYAGSSSVTITVTIHDQYGNEYVQTPINVTVAEDTEDSNPFFVDLPTMRTTVNTPYSIDVSQYVQDVEGPSDEYPIYYFDPDEIAYYVNMYSDYGYSEYIPYLEDDDIGYVSFTSGETDAFTSGVIEFEPTNDIVGTYPFTIATATALGYLDKQVAALNIVPDDAPDASIEMTLVTEATAVDDQGEVESLPEDAEWVNAWEDCSIEVWAKIDNTTGQFGIYSVETDLNFDPDQYQVSNIEWGVGFNQEQTGEIDNVNGTITGLGGTTKWYSVIPYYDTVGYAEGAEDAYPSSGTEDLIMWGDDQYVLVARVEFQPVVDSDAMTVQSGVGYNTAITPGFSLSDGDVKWNSVDGTDVTVDTSVDTEIWAVPFDLDGSGAIDLMDVAQFVSVVQLDLDATDWGYVCDFNRDAAVDLLDLGELLARFQYRADGGSSIDLPDYYPPTGGTTPVNSPAVAVNDTYTVDEDNVLEIDAANGLLANDSDSDGDALTATLITGPTYGTLELNGVGSFKYTPNADFYGTDTFTYVANDGTTNSSEATVTVTVNSVNDLPVATADAVTLNSIEATDINVLANDSDPEGETLAISAFDATSAVGATITLNTDGTLNYDPTTSTTIVDGTVTSDSFTYTITDGNTGVAVTSTVTVTFDVDTGITHIVFNGDSISVDGSYAAVDGSTVTLTSARTYILSGTLNDGQVIVNTDDEEDVVIILNGVNITCSDSAPIYVVNASDTVITLADNTENYVTDGATYVYEAGVTEPNAAIYSNDDLIIEGNGSLTVSANYNNGISSSDDLDINSGNITVTAVNHGIKGKDSVVILDGTITINAGGDGIQSDNDEDTEKGYVTIQGGTLNITADSDGIQAETMLTVSGGDVTIVSENKGLKGVAGVTIESGAIDGVSIDIDSADNAIHSNGSVTISGGDITIATDEDGINADTSVTITGGDIDITTCYEGIECPTISIDAATIDIVSSNDGISGSSGDGTSGTVAIYGGTITIDAGTDGIQGEAEVLIAGGTLDITTAGGHSTTLGEDDSAKALKSDVDLVVSGGTITIDAADDAIHSNGTITISGGDMTLATGDDGINGGTSVTITDGDIEITTCYEGIESPAISISLATIDITSSNDGIAGSSEDGTSGTVTINSGTITIDAGSDGIQGEANILIAGGTFDITTGGGNNATLGSDETAKAIKSDVALAISGGTFTIDSADDAIHSNDTITISGGDMTITSGDDGVHADSSITIDGGDINITKSYEGIESLVITINNGTIHIVSSDDGLNVAGGTDNSGFPFPQPPTGNSDAYLELTGGYIYINAQGDGCDSNGSVYMSGGTMIVNGPTGNDNGALDYDGTFEVTGGFLLAVGSVGMAESTSASSTQETLAFSYGSTQSAGVMIHIETESGEEILTFVPVKAYQTVVLCTPDLALGTTYEVYSGGSSTGTETDGLYSDGTYTAGTRLGSITLS